MKGLRESSATNAITEAVGIFATLIYGPIAKSSFALPQVAHRSISSSLKQLQRNKYGCSKLRCPPSRQRFRLSANHSSLAPKKLKVSLTRIGSHVLHALLDRTHRGAIRDVAQIAGNAPNREPGKLGLDCQLKTVFLARFPKNAGTNGSFF